MIKLAKFAISIIFLMAISFSLLAQTTSLFKHDPLRLPDGVEELYSKGLSFLQKNQTEKGNWPLSHHGSEPAVVGLCVLAFLARGDDPETGPYAKNIKSSINYILSKMRDDNGYIGNSMYNHGFATLTLAEVYGVIQDDRIGPALEKAVKLIVSAQKRNPYKAWRYTPDSTDADTTASGACMVALFAAANAGLDVPAESIRNGLEFYASCQDINGGIGYTNSQGANTIRTAIASLVWALAKEKKSTHYLKTINHLKGAGPESIEESYLFYGLYYLSQAIFHHDPSQWEQWNLANINFLKKLQAEDGSWNSIFGPEFSTASALLSLALNYRYLPIYEK